MRDYEKCYTAVIRICINSNSRVAVGTAGFIVMFLTIIQDW